jgi:cellulose synthase/poly-beta-1,6-N-acetylglucosamine synthase-like glycosyltransferase
MAKGELILFTDARQRIAPDAISLLAGWFADPRNGAVSGSLEIEPSLLGAGKALDSYWRFEKKIRWCESEIDSSIGCTGAIYMIRRQLFQPIPHDTLLDDVIIPMNIAMQGFRVRFDPEARAYDPQMLDGPSESRRKTRTLAGNFQMLFRHPQWLLPSVNRLWWQLITHKYLRILAPFFLIVCIISSWQMRVLHFYALALGLQAMFWSVAVVGLFFPRIRWRALSIPAGFTFLQISVVRGFFFWLTSLVKPQGGWK